MELFPREPAGRSNYCKYKKTIDLTKICAALAFGAQIANK
jgi:hypothetical protein